MDVVATFLLMVVGFAAPAVGAWTVGRALDRGGFSFDGIFRKPILVEDTRAREAWLLALVIGLLWWAAWSRVAVLSGWSAVPNGPVCLLLSGLTAGLVTAILGAEPLGLLYGAASQLPKLVALGGWFIGVLAGHVVSTRGASMAAIVLRFMSAGRSEMLDPDGTLDGGGAAVLGAGAAAAIFWHLLRQPVVVRPGSVAWPLAGIGLAVFAVIPLNLTQAVGDLLQRGSGWQSLIAPGLVAVVLLAGGWRSRPAQAASVRWQELAIAAGAGWLLGLASFLAGGDPAWHLLFGVATCNMGSMIYAAAFGCGAGLMGLLEWKLRGRPGGKPVLGHGI